MPSYHKECNCCGHAYDNAVGARAYIKHVKDMTYYAAGIAPDITWGLTAQEREFLQDPITFELWCAGYTPKSVEAFGWSYGMSFAGLPKAPEYQAWRDSC